MATKIEKREKSEDNIFSWNDGSKAWLLHINVPHKALYLNCQNGYTVPNKMVIGVEIYKYFKASYAPELLALLIMHFIKALIQNFLNHSAQLNKMATRPKIRFF